MNRFSSILGFSFASLVIAVAQPGCSSESTGNSPDPLNSNGFGNGNGSGGGAGGAGGGGSSPLCQGSGSSIPLPTGDLCTGDLGRKLFRFATCSCKTTGVAGALSTDSFNSTTGTSKQNGGSVGANEKLTDLGAFDIGGSVYVGTAGAPGMGFQGAGGGVVKNDIWSGKDVSLAGVVSVGRDIHATGNVSAMGIGSVGGTAHLSAGHSMTGFYGAKSVTEDVAITNPCDCEKKLDIAGLVPHFKTNNDNAQAHIDENALNAAGVVDLTLPCGRYYFSSVKSSGAVAIHVQGRVGMFVAGDFATAGAFDIDLAPGAELDLFVAGNFGVAGASKFGSVAAPSKVRVYSAGTQFSIAGASAVGGNFYAPNATITMPGAFEMSGSIFGDTLAFGGAFKIHYDEAVIDLEGCKPPGQGCTGPDQCPATTPACKNGTCVQCTNSDQCASPLTCRDGKCISDVH